MSKRAQPYLKKPFESDGRSSDVSANIYFSMLTSPAWLDLTSNQKNLYVICKMQLYAEKHKPDGDRSLFTLNQAKWAFCKFQPLSTTCTEKQLHFHGDSAPLSRA